MSLTKIFCYFLVFLFSFSINAKGQYETEAKNTDFILSKLSISNPIALVHKTRLKLEFRQNQGGLVFGASINYITSSDNFGYQGFIEGRYYLANTLRSPFFYGKFGYGNSTVVDFDLDVEGPYDFAFVGGGFGMSRNLGKRFFHEFNVGAKYCFGAPDFNDAYMNSFFSWVGAGSLIDCNYHLGFYLNKPTIPLELSK